MKYKRYLVTYDWDENIFLHILRRLRLYKKNEFTLILSSWDYKRGEILKTSGDYIKIVKCGVYDNNL